MEQSYQLPTVSRVGLGMRVWCVSIIIVFVYYGQSPILILEKHYTVSIVYFCYQTNVM